MLCDSYECMKVAQTDALTKQTIFSISDVKNEAVSLTSEVV
ncbi:hypothetical protein ECDEC14A_1453 [Escherichia coli DEC14A]|nr:hypothetical protein EC182770_2097 [Escherichia coli 1827-70]EFW50493.1 hypothetical protein SDB_02071 [Shigella dysenteriae CDC 74-1112]EGK24030.1 hypothetical protein SFK218_2196 [Shigella flexneri K-218]EHU93933.1 hypothetical protein ECDEC4A_1820 [Escherichia coli DEC4A]EHV59458.1 hypothetical protein ECDEC6A_1682 [Escherichia coli DEC6A]EHV73225.1 hypothetical protein ECDEC6D_1629 [Escherichia coli DEC6D]EHW39914.1 hypothetical protein ECDEC9A_1800 [Escherichia coli DEC9A]EHW59604.1 